MNKNAFSEVLKKWMNDFLKSRASDVFEEIEVLIPKSHLSKLNNEHLKSIPNCSSWDFKPDVLGILKNKKTGEIKLALLNRSISTLSLKEVGEINLYSRLVDAEFAFLVSTRGTSSETNLLLLENEIQERLLNYSGDKKIMIFSWQEDGIIDPKSIIPLDSKEFLLGK